MTLLKSLSLVLKTFAVALLVLVGAVTAEAQPGFPGFDYQPTGVFVDNDDDGIISCGDHVEFRARIGIAQGAPFPVEDGEFGATMLSNGRVVVGSVDAVNHHPAGGPVVVTEGNTPGDIDVRVDLGTVCPPDTCPPPGGLLEGATVTFLVEIRNPNFAQLLTVPGFARGSNYAQTSNQPSVPYEECEPPTGPGEVDLFITKDDGGITAPAGSVVAYELSFGNDGSRAATGVVLTETVPPHAFFDAAGSSAGWSCADGAPAGTTCTRSVGNFPPGSATSAVFAVRIASTLPAGVGQTTNTATISDDGSNGPDADPGNNTSTDTTPIAAAPDLGIAKSDAGTTTTPGSVVVYTLDYINLGTQGAAGVALGEQVPDHATFDAAGSSDGWTCADGAPAGTLCARPVGALPVGAGGSATFAVRVVDPVPPAVDQIVNTASIADDGANGPDLDPSDNTSTDATPVAAAPDLFVVKDDGGATAGPGDTVVYDIVYGNDGSQGASGVEVTDVVPVHAVFDGPGSSSHWTCTDGAPPGTVCTLPVGSLAAGETSSVPFAVRVDLTLPPGVDELVNTAVVADDGANGPDLHPSDNTSTDSTPVGAAPDLAVVKDDGGVAGQPDTTVAYALTYSNTGTQGATGVVLSDEVPDHTTFDAIASSAGWSCADGAPPGTECTLVLGGLAAGSGGQETFAVRVDASLPPGVDELVNTATIADDGTNGPDLDPSNNTSTDTTPIGGPGVGPDLAVTKDDGGVTAGPGEVVVYQLAYSNLGPLGATGVELTEVVPQHSTFEPGASSPAWSCVGVAPPPAGLKPERVQRSLGGVSCTLSVGTLPAGEGGSAVFAVRVVDPVPGGVTEIDNVVSITDDGTNGPDLNPADNSSTDSTPLDLPPPGSPLLDAFKTDVPDHLPAEPGDAITYIVTIVNAGDSSTAEVVFESDAPEHTVLVAGTVSTTHGTILEGQEPGDTAVAVQVGDLEPDEEAVVTFQVAIDAELPPEVEEIVCQGSVTTIDLLGVVLTDDPDTLEIDDPTRTPIAQATGPGPAEIPAAGTLGLLALAGLLVLAAIFRLRTATS